MSVLKKVDSKELAARKAAAEQQFRARKSGYDAFASTDPKTGRAIGAHRDGGIIAVLCPTPLDLIPVYVEHLAAGYMLHEIGVVCIDHARHEIYFTKPEDQIQIGLIALFAEVVENYRLEIETYNESVIEKEIEAQLAIEARRIEREQLALDVANRERIAAEVRKALGVK